MVTKKKSNSSGFINQYGNMSFWSVLFLVLLVFGAGFYVGNSLLSGRVVLGFEDLFGGKDDLVISLRQGELLPGSSSIIVQGKTENYTFLLSDLVNATTEGNFYVDGFDITENGIGYGTIGVIRSYPEIFFTLLVGSSGGGSSEGDSGVDEGEGSGEVVVEENVTETPEEESNETIVEEETNQTPVVEEVIDETPVVEEETPVVEETPANAGEITGDAVSENSEEEGSGSEESASEPESIITGEVIANELEEVEGSVNYNNDFTYFVGEKSVGFKPGSINIEDGAAVDYLFLDLEVSDGEVVVSTDYMVEEEGFGERFLGEGYELRIDLEELGVNLSDVLDVSLVYGEDNLASVHYADNEAPVVEEKVLNESLLPGAGELKQYGAVVGRPVKWVKVVNVSKDNALVEVPKTAENLTVVKGESEIKKETEEADKEDVVVEIEDKEGNVEQRNSILTGHVSLEIDKNEGILTRLFSSLWKSLKFTGNVLLENGQEETVLVDISSEVTSETENETVAVTYYTPAPISNESVAADGEKRIVVSAPDEYNYTDVFVYTSVWDVPGLDNIPVTGGRFAVKWYPRENVNLDSGNSVEEDVQDLLAAEDIGAIGGEAVVLSSSELELYDVDSDGLVDFVGWVVPHLSAQTYEIILITDAVELDSERNFVRDVYDEVSALDGNYVTIVEGNYVRVTFEQELDNTKDITIYARNACSGTILVNGVDVPCEIYYKKLRLDELRRENG